MNNTAQQFLIPKSWGDFQHYKDRSPTWIKLHRNILDNRDYQRLPLASKALAPMLWLLASEYESGKIPLDYDLIAFRFRMTEEEVAEAVSPLISKGFFSVEQSASEVLAECLPREEKRREREEKETEEEKNTPDKRAASLRAADLVSLGVPEQIAQDFLAVRKAKRAPLTNTALQLITAEASKAGCSLADALAVCAARGWQSFRSDWVASGGKQSPPSKHGGFDQVDYHAGVNPDGTF